MRWCWCSLVLIGCDHVFGLARPPDASGGICFDDDFSGPLDDRWTITAPEQSQVTVTLDGALNFHYVQGATARTANRVISVEAYDFQKGSVAAEILDPPALHRETSLRLTRSVTDYYGAVVRFDNETASTPSLIAKRGDDGILAVRDFDHENDRWLRISAEGARVAFETSSDGTSWVEFASDLVRFPMQALSISLDAYVTSDANTPSGDDPADDVRWDNARIRSLECESSR